MSPVEIANPSDMGDIKLLIESCKLSTDYAGKADLWIVKRLGIPGKLVGCVAIERRENRVHLQSLSVAKKYRRRGYAREMVDHVYANYLSPGDSLIALTLFWNIRFYYKIGFRWTEAAPIKMADDVGARKKHLHCTALIREKLS